jgi:hypothetical protein
MKAHLIGAAAALALSSVYAHADSWFSFEAGAGIASYTKTGPGIYYTPGFTHSTPINAPAFRVGAIFNALPPSGLVPGVRVNADYINFGSVSWDAQAPQDESDFTMVGQQGGWSAKTGACVNNNCGQMSDFKSNGRIQAIAMTVEPFWDVGRGFQVGIEAGPALFRATWIAQTTVETAGGTGKLGPVGSTSTLSSKGTLHLGAIVGVSVAKGPWAVRYNYLYAPAHNGVLDNDLPSGVRGAHMVSVNYTY